MKTRRAEPATLDPERREIVELSVLNLLLAERDCYHGGLHSGRIPPHLFPKRFNIGPNGCGYYAEAYGIMRSLVLLGYGYFGPHYGGHRDDRNVNAWFVDLENRALQMEEELGLEQAVAIVRQQLSRPSRGK